VEPEVAEAAALAHDLGHPPFGHIAEEVLDERITGDDRNIVESSSKASASRTAGDTSIPRS
jgi:HD superfamily phosphohydrolase